MLFRSKPLPKSDNVLPPDFHRASQPDAVSVTLKTPFSQVFSVTGKVVLALFLIGLGIGLIYLTINGIGSASYSGTGTSDYTNTYMNSREYYDNKADEALTKMPLSAWKTRMAADISGHCVKEGMTSAEVEKAVGSPTSKKALPPTNGATSDKAEAWEYVKQEKVDKPCGKYDGEKCADPVEYETKKATLYFSPNGHLTYPYLSGQLKVDLSELGCY